MNNEHLKHLKFIITSFASGMIGGILVVFLILVLKNRINSKTGSIADGIGSLGAIISLLFIWFQIKEAKMSILNRICQISEFKHFLDLGFCQKCVWLENRRPIP